MYNRSQQRRLIRIAKYLGKNELYSEANNIKKIATELESDDNEQDPKSLMDKILSLFNSNKNRIISYLTGGKAKSASRRNKNDLRKEAFFEKIPFAAEALSIYFYIIDGSKSLPIRVVVAAYLLGISGVIGGETAMALISQIGHAIPGVGTAISAGLGFLIADIEALTLAAAIPSLIAIYEFLVDDKHVEQAKEWLSDSMNVVDPLGTGRGISNSIQNIYDHVTDTEE